MRQWCRLLPALAALAFPTLAHAQQQATITGRVTNEAGAPLASVNVFVPAMSLGGVTGANGTYSIAVPAARIQAGQQVQVTAQMLGYGSRTETVTLSAGATAQRDFVLTLDPLRLTEIVATGVGTESRVERLGTARAAVDAPTLQRANEANVVQALAGKVPNLITNQQTGDPGSNTSIQIRGAKSFGASQPLIVVDGVPVNNNTRLTSSAGPNSTTLQGATAPNRGVDINPEDIASIEILKGAAATSIYGASAGSAGAILITTKRGAPGRTQYSLRSTLQFDEPIRTLPMQRRFGVGTNGVSTNCTTVNCAINAGFFSWGPELAAGTPTYDHSAEMFETGRIFDNTIAMSGGTERTTFYLSLGALDHQGFMVEDNDYFKRYSGRVNASHMLREDLTIGASASYVQTRGSGNQRGNAVGGVLGALRTPPDFNNRQYLDPETGLHRSWRFPRPGPTALTTSRGFDNPFYFINEAESTAESGRVFGNISAAYTPLEWLSVNYVLGADYTSDDRTEAFPISSSSTQNGGELTRWQFYDRIIDHTLTATGTFTLSDAIASSLTVGQNLNETYFRQVGVTGRQWIAPRPYKLSNTVQREPPTDAELRTRTEGYFAQATADIADQLFVQARIRNDGNSRFGVDNQRAWYPGGSVAWSFTKMLSMPENILTFGKARIAYGETGQQPPIYATQDVFTNATLNDFNPGAVLTPTQAGFGGLYASTTKGNANIKPERVKELEFGFDLSLLNGRVDFSGTRYLSRSEDVVFTVATPPSTGYTLVNLNAGELSNKGWEASLNVRPLQRSNFAIEIGANWAMNRNLVESLGMIDLQRDGTLDRPTPENCGDVARLPRCETAFGFPVSPGGGNITAAFTGQATHAQVGYPVGVWRAQDYARCGRGLTTINTNDIAAACQGAPDGALYIAANGYPIADPNIRVVGDPEPDWTGGINAVVTLYGVQVSALVEHRQGGDVLNMTRASLYQYGTHKDTELRGELRTFGKDWLCQNKTCDVLNGPVVGPGANMAVPLSETWFTGANGAAVGSPATSRIEDGTNTRLREISVGYSFRGGWVNRLGGMNQIDMKLSGRNLALWTDYTGYDPETNLGGAQAFNRGIDWFNNPLARAWVLSFTLLH